MDVREYSFRGVAFKIACLHRYAQDASWFSHEDESIVRDRDWHIGPGDVVIDIGSAFGSYSLTALASGASHVVCFNPNQEENGFVRESLRLNGWEDRATIYSTGLYSKSGWLRDTDQTFSEIAQEGFFEVKALDDVGISFPGDLTGTPWMKIDVEGGEVHVLQGARGVINKYRPNMLIENHQFIDHTLEQRVVDFLVDFDYKFVHCVPHHGVSHSLLVPR